MANFGLTLSLFSLPAHFLPNHGKPQACHSTLLPCAFVNMKCPTLGSAVFKLVWSIAHCCRVFLMVIISGFISPILQQVQKTCQ